MRVIRALRKTSGLALLETTVTPNAHEQTAVLRLRAKRTGRVIVDVLRRTSERRTDRVNAVTLTGLRDRARRRSDVVARAVIRRLAAVTAVTAEPVLAVRRVTVQILIASLTVRDGSLELKVHRVVAVLLLKRTVDNQVPRPGLHERVDLLDVTHAARIRAERRLTIRARLRQVDARVEARGLKRCRHTLTSRKRELVHNVMAVRTRAGAHRRVAEALRRVRQLNRQTLRVERVHDNSVVTRVALLRILSRRADPDRPAVKYTLVTAGLVTDLYLPRTLRVRSVERAKRVLALRVRVRERRVVVRKTRRVRITLVVDRHARAVRSHELQAQVSKLRVLHVRAHAHLRHVRVVRVHLDRLDNALEVLDRRVHST